MKNSLIWAFALMGLSASAATPVQKTMTETFVRYASINSQSNEDSVCTAGQHTMALALKPT